jgi:WD40 repeat protein
MRYEWFIVCLVASSPTLGQSPVVLEGHDNVISAIRFSSDGKQLVSSSWDKTVRVWNLESKQQRHVLRGHRDWVHDAFLSSDDKSLYSTSQKGIRKWSLESGTETAHFPGLGGASVNCAAFSPDGTLVVTGGRNGVVQVWKVSASKPMLKLGGFTSWVSAIAVSPDSKTLAAGTRTGRIRVFDLPSGKERLAIDAFPNRLVLSLEISPDSKTLASGGFTQTAILWDLATGKQSAELSGHRGVVTALTWSPDEKMLATGERHGSVHIWNLLDNNRLQKKIKAHSDGRLGFSVTALCFSADSKRIASGSYDKVIKVWGVNDDK